MTPSWFDRAIEAIDLANSDCPDVVVEAGAARPKEVVHSERMTDWVIRLAADPTPAQLLAARAHHLRRWVIARRDFPEGRSGYLRWREAQKRRQGDDLRDLLDRAGCPPDVAEDAAIIVAKATRGGPLATAGQVHEDALCLVFLELKLDELAERLGDEHAIEVLARTMAKMSDTAIEAVGSIPLSVPGRRLVERAARPKP